MEMIKFVIDETALPNGVHHIHNATTGCENLPQLPQQIFIGFFANYQLAYKRARMSWPTEKVQGCPKCCTEQ